MKNSFSWFNVFGFPGLLLTMLWLLPPVCPRTLLSICRALVAALYQHLEKTWWWLLLSLPIHINSQSLCKFEGKDLWNLDLKAPHTRFKNNLSSVSSTELVNPERGRLGGEKNLLGTRNHSFKRQVWGLHYFVCQMERACNTISFCQ